MLHHGHPRIKRDGLSSSGLSGICFKSNRIKAVLGPTERSRAYALDRTFTVMGNSVDPGLYCPPECRLRSKYRSQCPEVTPGYGTGDKHKCGRDLPPFVSASLSSCRHRCPGNVKKNFGNRVTISRAQKYGFITYHDTHERDPIHHCPRKTLRVSQNKSTISD